MIAGKYKALINGDWKLLTDIQPNGKHYIWARIEGGSTRYSFIITELREA